MLSAVCGIYLAKLHNRAMTSVKSAAFADKLKVGSCPRETFYVSIAVPMAAYPVPLSTRKVIAALYSAQLLKYWCL
jgi:hypothetical protein